MHLMEQLSSTKVVINQFVPKVSPTPWFIAELFCDITSENVMHLNLCGIMKNNTALAPSTLLLLEVKHRTLLTADICYAHCVDNLRRGFAWFICSA